MLSFPSQNDKKKISDSPGVLEKNTPGWQQTNIFLSLFLLELISKIGLLSCLGEV